MNILMVLTSHDQLGETVTGQNPASSEAAALHMIEILESARDTTKQQ